MIGVNDSRLKVINWFDGAVWRAGKFVRKLPFYDQINSATIVRGFCADAEARLTEMPQRVNIETINRCNGGCRFCPANSENDPRPAQYMSDLLIQKIAAELAAEHYAGSIALHINNEPLLDARIPAIVGILRKACPDAEIFLSTNGSLLTDERYLSLFDAGLSHLIVNNYCETRRLTEKISTAFEQILSVKHPRLTEYLRNTVILLKNRNEILNSRAGDAPNKKDKFRYRHYQKNSCPNPFRQINILPDGRVSLCCEDFSGKVTIGNIEKESIRAVWNGAALGAVRAELKTRGRKALPTCQRCDYGHLGGEKAKSFLRYFIKWFSRV